MTPLFSTGPIVATPGALKVMADACVDAQELLRRHLSGDWGDVGEEDAEANRAAISDGSRILSAYTLRHGTRVWIITDAEVEPGQRYATTFLLPEEY